MNSKNHSALIYGKLPPQAAELERALLGAILLESECLPAIMEILPQPEAFYKHEHQEIYGAALAAHKSGSKVDMFTVADQLTRSSKLEEVGGIYALGQIISDVVSNAHATKHAEIILHYWQLREIIRVAGDMLSAAYEPDANPGKIFEECRQSLAAAIDTGSADTTVHVSIPAAECMTTIEKAMNNPGMLTGVDTRIREINRVTNGWQKQDVIILAARPSQGKTALALILSLNADKPVLFFSLEMSRNELVNRLLSSISGISLYNIQRGLLTPQEMQQLIAAQNALSRMKIFIDDKAGLTTTNFQSRVRRWKRKQNIGLVVIDYLQLMRVPDSRTKNREAQVSEISREIKLTAKESDLPIIALSQMNRDFEKGPKRKPALSDLRESGAIEQDASIVMFIWHEEDAMDGVVKNKIVFAKNRNGATEDVELRFIGATQRWTDADGLDEHPSFNPYAGMPGNRQFQEPEPF